ncbi:calcium-binding protein [Fulvimarina sp. 2208YS6-2-32]|uniref:Calcium-binding protein n=1 Tax=Fulvimarina uroteuthidis TaxID=3098149 RepID=A0ABU5I144_9HYPH|nr:calcium-binding protein [Fulvimarina sp. 2208YS6-2-32]MDY8108852.1 calcium-binding protein [Fulvimarina sp. 2208YS6-2-32]
MAANAIMFNEQFYLTQNPDVAAAVSRGQFASGQAHFNQFGRFESRDPNAFFDTSFYLGQYPDVAAAGVNPLTHFLAFGAREGRVFNENAKSAIDTDNNGVENFNDAAYLTANPDVAAAVTSGQFANGYQHYILFGQFEGRPGAVTDGGQALNGPFAQGGTGGGANPGQTFTLTNSVDVLNGTANNDTFVGDAASVSGADQLNGSAGTDTFNSFGAGAAATIPQLNSIENVNFVAPVAGFTGANVSAIAGVQNLGLVNTAIASNLQINAAQNVSYTGVTGGAQTITTTAADTDVTATLSGSTVASLAVTGAGVTTINLAATGSAASTITGALSSTGTESTVNITGTQALTIGNALDASVKTVNASSNTGGVTVTLGASDATVTGGTGNDTFNFGATLTTADTVVGGAGTDTLGIDGADIRVAVANGVLPALNTKVSGIETLQFNGANAGLISGTTFTNTAVTKIVFNTADAATDTVDAAGSARVYAFGAANSGNALINLAAGVSTVNLSLDANATPITGGVEVGTLKIAADVAAPAGQTATVNLASTGPSAVVNTITALEAAVGSTFNVSGSNDLTITALTNGGTINASALTGKLTVTGSAANDVITGGTGADTLTGGDGVDTINGGAGADIIVGGLGADLLTGGAGIDTFRFGTDGSVAGTSLDKISDFNAGGADILDFGGAAVLLAAETNGTTAGTDVDTSAGGKVTFAAADTTFAQKVTAVQADTQLDVAGSVAFFENGANTYVYYAGAATGNADDQIVELTGITGLTTIAVNAAGDITIA